ncbi:hypothetical protein ACLILZ_34050, partial [Mycobacterium paragordonae]
MRRAVDDDPSGGQFLLAGSASPRRGATAHSGAGRIGRLRMRPMTLSERGIASPTVILGELLAGRRLPLGGATQVRLADYTHEIVASGFPGMRSLGGRALKFQLDRICGMPSIETCRSRGSRFVSLMPCWRGCAPTRR